MSKPDMVPSAKTVLKEDAPEKNWKDKTFFIVLRQFAKNKVTLWGVAIILILVIIGILAPVISPYNYKQINPINSFQSPCLEHIFGTDLLGRDIFSRICYGARYTLSLGVSAELAGLVLGIILGSIAGYYGGFLDNIILRFCDIFQSIPSVLFTIIISQVLGSGYVPTVIALAITGTPQVIRLLRAQFLSARGAEYVEAARTISCGNSRIMFKHLLPNTITPLIINSSLGVGSKIMTSATLSFLGVGVQEPTPEWGAMLAVGKDYFRNNPYLLVIPGIFIALTVLSFNLIGDGLRDALDSKQRR